MSTRVGFQAQPKFLAIIDQGRWIEVNDFGNWTEAVAGTGSTSRGALQALVSSGTTASSTALVRSGGTASWSRGKAKDVINWDKKVVLHVVFAGRVNTTNGKTSLSLGKTAGDGVAVLAREGIGFRVDDLAIKGIVHDGTSETVIDLSTTLVDEQTHEVTVVSDGAGNVEWFVDGVSKGSTASGPTGDSGATATLLQLDAENGADSANQGGQITGLKLYVEQ